MKIKLARTQAQKTKLEGPFKLFRFYKTSSRKKGSLVLELNLAKVIKFFFGTATIGYITASIPLFFWLDRRPHNAVTYWDIALPHRWDTMKEGIGKTLIAQGLEDFENEDYKKSLMKLRSGLVRYPSDFEARSKLAILYFTMGLHDNALTVLEHGFRHGIPDNNYITQFFQTASFLNKSNTALEVADRLLANETIQNSPERKQALEIVKIQSSIASNDFEKTLRIIQKINQNPSAPQKYYDLEMRMLVNLKRIDEALALINQFDRKRIYSPEFEMIRVEALTKSSQRDRLVDALRLTKQRFPKHSAVHLNSIAQTLESENENLLNAELHYFKLNFSDDTIAVKKLCGILSNFGYSRIIQQYIAYFPKNSETGLALKSYYGQALINEESYDDAKTVVIGIRETLNEETPRAKLCDWLIELADALSHDETAQIAKLESTLEAEYFPLNVYTQTTHLFLNKMNWEWAKAFANIGLKRYPNNPKLKNYLITAENKLKAIHLKHTMKLGDFESDRKQHLTINQEREDSIERHILRLK